MICIKSKGAFACIFGFVVFGLILIGQSDALKNPDSVVGVWLLDGDANDASGNDYHGELTGAPEWISGKFGMAVDLPGAGDTIQITGFGNTIPGEELTIMGWARIDEMINQDLFSLEPLEVGNRGRITSHMPWDNGVHWQFGPNGMGGGGVNDSHIGVWEHWATIHSSAGNYMRVVRNGEESAYAEVSAPFEHREANFHIGGRLGSSFAGAVDDFAIFSSVLGDDEIMALMNDGLMAYIGGGPTAVDPTGKAATTWAQLKQLD